MKLFHLSLFLVTSLSSLFAQPKNAKTTSPTTSGSLSNVVNVRNVWDFPPAFGNAITLDPTKVYVLGGMIDISPNHINLNGGSLVGTDPSRDGLMSSVNGAVLRSTDVEIYMEKVAVVPLTPKTTAYEFVDNTSTKFCNLLSGCSVVEVPRTQSGGVGSITGFNAIYINANFWRASEGLKLKGKTGKFCGSYNYMTGISIGAAIDFLPDFTASDIDLSNNYFVYSGQIAVRMNPGATVDQGRLAGNLFRGVATLLSGFDSHTPGWEMRQNGAGIPDTRPYGFLYMTDNETETTKFIAAKLYTKIAGATTTVKSNAFTSTNNRFTYTGKRPLTVRAHVIMSAKAPEANADFSVAIHKNGLELVPPNSSKNTPTKGEGFQLTLETVLDLVQGDYIEVFVKNNGTATPIVVRDLQFRVSE